MKNLKHIFKRFNINDERLINTRNKIGSEALIIILIITMVSIFYKANTSDDPFQSCIFEFIILGTTWIYYIIRSIMLGTFEASIELNERKHKTPPLVRNVLFSIIFGIGLGIYFGLRSSLLYGSTGTYILYFITVFFVCIAIYGGLMLMIMVPYSLMTNKITNQSKIDEE